jgi:hypothetical protein
VTPLKLLEKRAKEVARQINLPPDKGYEEPAPKAPFDFARVWRLAERKIPLGVIVELFGVTEEHFRAEILKHHKYSWDIVAARAPVELENDLLDICHKRARQGDIKFVLLLEKWGLLNPYARQTDRLGNASGRASLAGISTEELKARVSKLSKTVERKPLFAETGQLSPTLEVREAAPDGAISVESWKPVVGESDPAPDFVAEVETLLTVEDGGNPLVEPAQPEKLVRGPAIYYPPQTELSKP